MEAVLEKNKLNQYYLDGIRRKDIDVLSAVYDQYWSVLFVSAFKLLKDKLLSEDVIVKVFVDLWHKAAVAEIDNIEVWLKVSTVNESLKLLQEPLLSGDHN